MKIRLFHPYGTALCVTSMPSCTTCLFLDGLALSVLLHCNESSDFARFRTMTVPTRPELFHGGATDKRGQEQNRRERASTASTEFFWPNKTFLFLEEDHQNWMIKSGNDRDMTFLRVFYGLVTDSVTHVGRFKGAPECTVSTSVPLCTFIAQASCIIIPPYCTYSVLQSHKVIYSVHMSVHVL